MKKLFVYLIAVLSLTLFLPSFANAQEVGDKPLLYVRQGCPHCAKVEAFLDKYNLNDTVKMIETYNNEANTNELNSWFTKLNVTDPNQQGVPFLVVDDKTYFVGDEPIIQYLAAQHNITIDPNEYQSSTADSVFLLIGGLVLFGVIGYGIYNSLKKKN